ncbi:MAG TPA: D-alanine--D-alanine ligase [Casimicrobiaceae bacterium]|jgi:D-alanine-D-alanine ligase|nr:D-alanine--D-alanine ligase [Casimicrobiaceae bacterium]
MNAVRNAAHPNPLPARGARQPSASEAGEGTEDFGKVAVLLGGPSAEREVSLMSGNAVVAALRERGVDAHPFDPAERDVLELARDGFARVFIALHGRFGEDGTVQGVLETLGIPYTGSGVMASALAMDKWRTKLVWIASNIPTPRYRVVDATTDWPRIIAELGLPLVVKPAREGSTIGITRVEHVDHDELALAWKVAAEHDPLVLVEEFVSGMELTASIVNGRALPLIRIEAPHGNYDYHSKYFSDETKYFCPSGIDAALEARIRAQALAAFDVVGCTGWGRLDLILRSDGSYSFLEVNTSPGMTGHSLVPMAAKQAGMSFPELCVEILKGAHVG